MHADAASGAGTSLVEALLARVDELDANLQAVMAIDEKSLKEFRKTVEAISKRDPKFEERVTNRVDVIADRVETVARTISTTSAALAAKEGEIAQLRRELEASTARVGVALADAQRASDDTELAEIKRSLAELSKQKLPRGVEGRIEDLAGKVEQVSQRIDTVSSTVSTTAAGLAGRDGDVTSLRRALEADAARIEAELVELRRAVDPAPIAELRQAVRQLRDETAEQRHSYQRWFETASTTVNGLAGGLTELRASVESLSTGAAAREQAEADAARDVDDRISSVRARGDDLGTRLDSLSATMAATGDRFETRSAELAEMELKFSETSSRVDNLVGELTRALADAPDPRALEAELGARIDELSERSVELEARLERADATVPAQLHEALSGVGELDRRLVEEHGLVAALAARLETSTASTAERLSGGEAELASLRAYVEEGGTRLAAAVTELRQSASTVSEQIAALEEADADAERALDDRIANVAGAVDELGAGLTGAFARVAESERGLASVRALAEDGSARLGSQVSELKQQVTAFSSQLGALEHGSGEIGDKVSQLGKSVHELSEQVSEKDDALLPALSQRVDALAADVESAVTSLVEKEREVAVLQGHATESSTRIETIVEDIREALGTLPDASPEALAALTSKVESTARRSDVVASRLERLEAVHVDQVAAELRERFDRLDARVAAVIAEMGRAKTLWPVALRSMEARLDDVLARAAASHPTESELPQPEPAHESDHLLAGLRDNLHAMESVAEEMARASDAWASDGDASVSEAHEVSAGGARIVPLRASEP